MRNNFPFQIYDRLKLEQPTFMSHVVMIEGDTGAKDLGLTSSDREDLIENVNVIFHAAATVRFDESLSRSINTNVRGSKLIMKLAKQVRHLKVYQFSTK